MVAISAVICAVLGTSLGAVGAYTWIGTAQGIGILPIYALVALACPVYFLRYRRDSFRVGRHLIIPVLGVIAVVPAFFVGCGIQVASFITPLAFPLNLCGPFVGVFWLAGAALLAFHQRRNPSNLKAMAHVFEDPAEPVTT
jgi:amino acid transporter